LFHCSENLWRIFTPQRSCSHSVRIDSGARAEHSL
jgi:hypothetical protein